ncbi:MAG: Gfo/Idh/MocA family oxidoreductase [Ilumatobacteraceae bacterium]
MVSPTTSSSSTTSAVAPIRVGIVGAGYIAHAHVGAYIETPGVTVVGVADPVAAKAERVAKRCDATAMSSIDQLLESGIDLISICTPSPTHPDLVEQALTAGINVLCEKPVARTYAQAERIVEAARLAAGIVMIGHVSRFEPDHRRAQQIVAAGRLGELRMMSQSITSSMPGWSQDDWLSDTSQSGGPLVDLAIHSFDYLAWVNQSEPVRVHAVASDTAVGPATYALATVRYANGALGLVETSWAHPTSHGFKVSTELVGADGRINWDYDGLIGGVLNTDDGNSVRFDPLGNRGFVAEIGAMVEAIRTGSPAPVSAPEGLSALKTSLAALESVRTGQPIDLTTWSPS